MQQVATFEKVSFEQYCRDRNVQPTTFYMRQWEAIKLPTRATDGSAGYDFYFPQEDIIIGNTCADKVVTGIRARIDPGWALIIMPRSGLGFRYGLRLVNTIGLIDSDYYNADNEGHIIAKMMADDYLLIRNGDRFIQGILIPYGIATNDSVISSERTGGFGSTGK